MSEIAEADRPRFVDSADVASEMLRAHRDRVHELQNFRWQTQRFHLIATFSFFSWVLLSEEHISGKETLLALIPVVFNVFGFAMTFGIQQSITDRAKYLSKLEVAIAHEIPTWEAEWERLNSVRKLGSLNRLLVKLFWVGIISVSVIFSVFLFVGD